MTATPLKEYVASADGTFLYPALGDPTPPGGAKVQLLTPGGVAVYGLWSPTYMAWAPLPKRDRAKEALLEARNPSWHP